MKYTPNYNLKKPDGTDPVKIEDFNENFTSIDTALLDLSAYSMYKLNKDSNGIFTEVQYKRKDGTLIIKSVLSGGTSPKYTTRTETKYLANGTTIQWTKAYTLSYDTDDNLTSEVML